MNEQIRRQQFRFMLYNLFAFTLIFTLFGIILYGQIRNSLYTPVEESLQSSQEFIENSADYLSHQLELSSVFLWENMDKEKKPEEQKPPEQQDIFSLDGKMPKDGNKPDEDFDIPMRVLTVIRSTDGSILNPYALGRIYMENYLNSIPFDQTAEKPYTFALGNSYYVSLVFPLTDSGGEQYYIQLLSSLDGEQSILDHFVRLLIVCIIVFVLLSITASYYLSKKSMQPIITAWEQQTEFVGNASHELRTPLTIVQNKLESMLTRPVSTIMQETDGIAISLSEIRRLNKLTTDLMTLARADADAAPLEKASYSPDELIRTMIEPYAEMAQLQNKALTLELHCPQAIPLDKGRIHQLLVILLDNALKYTREGDYIHITTSMTDNRAVLEVADSGIGIPPEHIDRIFDRFYRADKARSRKTGGSGLGLSIAKWIVNMHGGTIAARSNPDGGTVFRVTFRA